MTGFGSIPAEGVRIFPGTIPPLPPAPYTAYFQAAIDAWLIGTTSTFVPGLKAPPPQLLTDMPGNIVVPVSEGGA